MALQDPYFKRRIHGPYFLFINWDHNPRHHQHQHINRVQAMNQSLRPILPLSYSWKAVSPTKNRFTQNNNIAQGTSSHIQLMIQIHKFL